MTENGDLIVLNVDKYAAGNYTCRATNMAGSRDTPPAIVWVYGKFQSCASGSLLWHNHGIVRNNFMPNFFLFLEYFRKAE